MLSGRRVRAGATVLALVVTTGAATAQAADTTPPEAPAILSPEDGQRDTPSPYNASGAPVVMSTGAAPDPESGTDHLEVEIDGVPVQAFPGGSLISGQIADGPHTMRLVAVNGVGLRGPSAPVRFWMDRSGSLARLLSEPHPGATTSVRPVFRWRAMPDLGGRGVSFRYRVRVDDQYGDWVSGTEYAWPRELAPGPHRARVEVVDSTGFPFLDRNGWVAFASARTTARPPVTVLGANGPGPSIRLPAGIAEGRPIQVLVAGAGGTRVIAARTGPGAVADLPASVAADRVLGWRAAPGAFVPARLLRSQAARREAGLPFLVGVAARAGSVVQVRVRLGTTVRVLPRRVVAGGRVGVPARARKVAWRAAPGEFTPPLATDGLSG